MFQIGDKIFYPMHGAGVIEAIEEKEILGKKELYYVMDIPLRNMQAMIPLVKTEDLGIRQVVDSEMIENIFTHFQPEDTVPIANPILRHRSNIKRMKSGDILEEAQVICDLTRMGKIKPLGAGDKILLNDARRILISELVMVQDIAQDQAADLLDKVIENF
jgi:CarD family transcriptional regulator